jgi:hypothetical protein
VFRIYKKLNSKTNKLSKINPCATKVLALLLYVFLVEQEIRIRDYLTADCDFFIFNKNLIIFFNKKYLYEFSALLKVRIKIIKIRLRIFYFQEYYYTSYTRV